MGNNTTGCRGRSKLGKARRDSRYQLSVISGLPFAFYPLRTALYRLLRERAIPAASAAAKSAQRRRFRHCGR